MTTRTILIATGIAAALIAMPAYANDNMSAQDFVTKASIANRFEIETSKLALKKAEDEDVKDFAQTMVDDHTKTGAKLERVLGSSDSKAKPATGLDSMHQEMLDKLAATSGEAFDEEYAALQTQAHKDAVALFGDYSANGRDKELKEFAMETLPTLQQHLKHVRELND